MQSWNHIKQLKLFWSSWDHFWFMLREKRKEDLRMIQPECSLESMAWPPITNLALHLRSCLTVKIFLRGANCYPVGAASPGLRKEKVLWSCSLFISLWIASAHLWFPFFLSSTQLLSHCMEPQVQTILLGYHCTSLSPYASWSYLFDTHIKLSWRKDPEVPL